jgi:ATP-dependent helicase HrpA
MLIRLERAKVNPGKDQERQTLLNPYLEALKQLLVAKAPTLGARQKLEEFRWMIEEYKVSLFAQELGTAVPISPQRLNRALEETREALLS